MKTKKTGTAIIAASTEEGYYLCIVAVKGSRKKLKLKNTKKKNALDVAALKKIIEEQAAKDANVSKASEQDLSAVQKLSEASKLIKFNFPDHITTGKDSDYSFYQNEMYFIWSVTGL